MNGAFVGTRKSATVQRVLKPLILNEVPAIPPAAHSARTEIIDAAIAVMAQVGLAGLVDAGGGQPGRRYRLAR